jgi:thiamine biosynthesis lipoprotein
MMGCSNEEDKKIEPVTKSEFLLGTLVDIKIYDELEDYDVVFDDISKRLNEIESEMTINRDRSEVISINENAGKKYVKVSDDTLNVIRKGKYFSEMSKGKFDISIGPLVKLWDIGSENPSVPEIADINYKKAKVDYKKVLINEKEKSVMLAEEGMTLDLGGIAKGYAADEIVKIFEAYNVKHGIINLGGNVYVHGTKSDGSDWAIGVQNPDKLRGAYIGIVNITDKTVVTSGIYERFFMDGDKRYHHILDPFTGFPVENEVASVTVIADKSIDADSLSTVLFSSGVSEGIELVEDLENVEAIYVTKSNELIISSGIKEIFEHTNKDFTIVGSN